MSAEVSSSAGRRLLEASEMHDVGLEMLRQRFRRERPFASDPEVEAMVRAWLADRPYDSPGSPVAFPRQ